MQPVVQWFDLGGNSEARRGMSIRAEMARQLNSIQGLMEKTRALGLTRE